MEHSGFHSMDFLIDAENNPSHHGFETTNGMHDTDGVLDLMRTLARLKSDPRGEVTIEADHGDNLVDHIEELERTDPERFPLEVHVFHPLLKHLLDVEMRVRQGEELMLDDFFLRMHRNHSFIVLGRDSAGRMLCMHKASAKESDRVTIAELSDVVWWGFSLERDGDHLVALGPTRS